MMALISYLVLIYIIERQHNLLFKLDQGLKSHPSLEDVSSTILLFYIQVLLNSFTEQQNRTQVLEHLTTSNEWDGKAGFN